MSHSKSRRGRFSSITGPSGCGKSTLLNIIAGLDTDYEGDVDLGPARDQSRPSSFRPRGFYRGAPFMKISRSSFPTAIRGTRKFRQCWSASDLHEAANAYPERLSLGMQRRAALARGFILQPEILLMDEPFVSLDDPTATSLRELLMELWHSQPTTVIFVTHDRAEAIQLGTRILRLCAGKGECRAGCGRKSERCAAP